MEFQLNGGRPGDERGFIHKKLLGGISSIARFLPIPAPIATAISGITSKIAGGSGSKAAGEAFKFPGGDLGPRTFGPPQRAPCDFPMVRDPQGRCRTPTSGPQGGPQFDVGEAVMGRYGAALEPGSRIIDRAICLRGMQLGDDGLCYNKSQISNKQRMWPAGRKPLLTGGDMRAISTAARAGRRLDLATKRLQKMGMMKKPTTRRAPHAHAKAAPDVVSV